MTPQECRRTGSRTVGRQVIDLETTSSAGVGTIRIWSNIVEAAGRRHPAGCTPRKGTRSAMRGEKDAAAGLIRSSGSAAGGRRRWRPAPARPVFPGRIRARPALVLDDEPRASSVFVPEDRLSKVPHRTRTGSGDHADRRKQQDPSPTHPAIGPTDRSLRRLLPTRLLSIESSGYPHRRPDFLTSRARTRPSPPMRVRRRLHSIRQ